MTSPRKIIASLLTLATLAASGAALASGNHAGGHGGHGEAAQSPIGQPGSADKVGRTITLEMSDAMRFSPAKISVRRGDTVRLVVKNTGQVKHEINLGTHKEILEHLEVMKKFPDMEHDEPGKLSLAPGQQGEIIWQFTKAGVVDFACLLPGHYEAGMRGAIAVSRK